MKKEEALKSLQNNPNISGVPKSQLVWLLEHGEVKICKEGDYIFRKDEPADHLIIFLSGRAKLYLKQKDSIKEMGILEAGDVSGVLPFSRLKVALGYAEVVEPTCIFLLHRDQFQDLIRIHYELTEKFVHLMTSRVREFTSIQQQDEKMMALGKLSAGLAHELNNPAAAIVRSSDSLIKHLKSSPEKFKQVISMKVDEKQVDRVNAILFAHLSLYPRKNMSMRDKMKLEEDFLDWLDDHEVENADDIADNLVEYGFSIDDLEQLKNILESEAINPVLNWINNVLTTERTVSDIHEASKRISELVQSVKSYSHMDRAPEKVKTNLHVGISDTLKLLDHKIKSARVRVSTDFDDTLPEIMIYPGQINQVWTNIIDNAIDALVDVDQAEISIHTFKDNHNICVEISDNGEGIPSEIINRIFDPFYTTKEVGKGSGMGLDISRKIISSHNGKIEVSSKKGYTVFKIILPLEQ